jgi:hypothetical protein
VFHLKLKQAVFATWQSLFKTIRSGMHGIDSILTFILQRFGGLTNLGETMALQGFQELNPITFF